MIDISNELAKVLKEWRLACPHSELNLVFPNSNGKYQSADNLAKRRFLPALNRAGIDKIRFHDLRHTVASHIAMNGGSLLDIAQVTGHKTMQMVKRYSHLTKKHTAELLESTTQIMFSEVKNKQ